MVEKTTKILIDKVDGTEDCQTGRAGGYGFRTLPGAELALYEARRIYTDNTEKYPRGYYLEKKTEEPFSYTSTDSRRTAPEKLTAQWTTGTCLLYTSRTGPVPSL